MSNDGARGVVVLGMGRSGTSSVTRMFHRSGYFLGAAADMMDPDDANPTGYFENWRVWRANEYVLERLGAAWFEPPSEGDQLASADELRQGLRAVRDELLAEAGSRPLALKDPRIGPLMPLWWPLLENVVHPVLVLRDPLEVALSLERRDLTALPVALAMWELHLTRTLAQLQGCDVTVVRYREVVNDPALAEQIVRDASRHLRAELVRAVSAELAPSALAQQLYRNRAETLAGTHWLTAYQRRLWSYLDSLPSGTSQLLAPRWTSRSNEETYRLARYERRRQRAHDELEARLERAAADVAERDRVLDERLGVLTEQSRQLEEQSRKLDQQGRELDQQGHDLDQQGRELEGLVARASSAEAQHAATAGHLEQATRRLHEAERRLAVIQDSTSWRVTGPLRSIAGMARRASVGSLGRAGWVAIALTTCIAVCDAATGRKIVLLGLVALGPCVTLPGRRWVVTALVGSWALVVGIPLGVTDGIWDSGRYFRLLGLVLLIAVLSTYAAAVIERRSK